MVDKSPTSNRLAEGQVAVPERRLMFNEALNNAKKYAAAQVEAGNGLVAVPEWAIEADSDYFDALVKDTLF